jgi:hypothetical protein
MSNHDKRKRSRKIFDAIKGESAGDVREFYESKFRDPLAKDDTLMKRALRLNMDVVGTGNKDPLVFLIHEMTQQALDDVRESILRPRTLAGLVR